MFFSDEPASVCPQGLTQHQISSINFFRFRSDLLAFFARILYFLKFWSLRNLMIKQLFNSRLLDMRLVIANSALRSSLSIYQGLYDL